MNPLVIGIEQLEPARFPELQALLATGSEVLIEHRNGHRVPLLFAPNDPAIPNARPVVLGLHAGMIDMADDFNAPLPADEWGGAFE